MKISLTHNGTEYQTDLNEGVDLSIAITSGESTVNAYYAHPVSIVPYKQGNWVGEIQQGGSVNYRNIFFNPHGNGTHTECVGHIAETIYSVNQYFSEFHSVAKLITVTPRKTDSGDFVISVEQLSEIDLEGASSVIIRTLPNEIAKRTRNYSGKNPPYLTADAVIRLVCSGCRHLVLDLPSVDREQDHGKLSGHRAFWKFPDKPRMDCTITELAFIPNEAKDGLYLLNLQVAAFENDAAPSRPVIFPLIEV